MRYLIWAIGFIWLATGGSFAGDIAKSSLYKHRVRDCSVINLQTWQHPTKTVFQKYKIELQKAELCNNKIFPIFTFESKYDPRLAATDSFFLKLYSDLARANGWWSYALVDTTDDIIIFVDANKSKQEISANFEEF